MVWGFSFHIIPQTDPKFFGFFSPSLLTQFIIEPQKRDTGMENEHKTHCVRPNPRKINRWFMFLCSEPQLSRQSVLSVTNKLYSFVVWDASSPFLSKCSHRNRPVPCRNIFPILQPPSDLYYDIFVFVSQRPSH